MRKKKMEHKLSKLKVFKQISLTTDERNLMRAHAARVIMTTPVSITESFFKRGAQYGLRLALSSVFFVLFIAGSVSAVANNALPGDPLYSFKINVNEEVKGLFLKTPTAQALYQSNRIENRVSEIQTLADSNSLTQANQATAAKAISNQVADLSANLTTLSAQSPSSALTVTASLAQTLKANKITLENTPATTSAETNSKSDAIATVNSALQTVSNQEVQILSKQIDAINAAVATVPTTTPTDAKNPTVTTTATQTADVTTPPITPVAP
jgi:hypothetical protein